MPVPRSNTVLRACVATGVLVPLFYYGVQVVVAAFNPGYSFVRQAASELGSDLARNAWLFNTSIMAQAVLTLVVAIAAAVALVRLGRHRAIAAAAFVVLALNAVQSFWAAYFPMPDPRHGGHPAFVIAMIALPFVLAIASWPFATRAARTYFILTLVLLAAIFPFMAGLLPIDTSQHRGLLQRVFTLTVFIPIAVSSWLLQSRLARRPQATHPAPATAGNSSLPA